MCVDNHLLFNFILLSVRLFVHRYLFPSVVFLLSVCCLSVFNFYGFSHSILPSVRKSVHSSVYLSVYFCLSVSVSLSDHRNRW